MEEKYHINFNQWFILNILLKCLYWNLLFLIFNFFLIYLNRFGLLRFRLNWVWIKLWEFLLFCRFIFRYIFNFLFWTIVNLLFYFYLTFNIFLILFLNYTFFLFIILCWIYPFVFCFLFLGFWIDLIYIFICS